MIGSVLGLGVCLFGLVVVFGMVRARVHRLPGAHGDRDLVKALDALTGRRTRNVAIATIDLGAEQSTRFAFIGADESTRFEIGSITKALTGMLVALAVELGEVSMDTTISEIIAVSGDTGFGTITMKELCTHASGLPGMALTPSTFARSLSSGMFGLDPYQHTTPSEVIKVAARQRLRNRGTHRYSNLGAAVLGQLLAVAADTEFPTSSMSGYFGPSR